MKKLIFTIAILIPLILVGQEQNSLLQKGMVFHAPLSEWHNQPGGSADLISGKLGTSTGVQNVMGRGGSGNRWYQFDGVDDYVELPTIQAFGTGDFSMIIKFRTDRLINYQMLSASSTFNGYVTIYINISGDLNICGKVVNSIVAINTDYLLIITRKSDVLSVTLNGTEILNTSFTDDLTLPFGLLGKYVFTDGYFSGKIALFRVFNYALSAEDLVYYGDPANSIKAADKGADGVDVLSGWNFMGWGLGGDASFIDSDSYSVASGGGVYKLSFTGFDMDKKYTMSMSGSISAGSISVESPYGSLPYVATTTFPVSFTFIPTANGLYLKNNASSTTDISAMKLYKAGCLLDLTPNGMITTEWDDLTNSTVATVSGSTLKIPVNSNLGASNFNGTSSNITFTDMPDLTGDITVSFWCNFADLSGYQDILATVGGFRIYLYGSHFDVYRNGSTFRSSIGFINTNTWFHIVVTSKADGYTDFYSDAVHLNGGSGATPIGATTWSISGYNNSTNYYNGLLSDFRVYNRILSPSEITLLYRRGPQN